jgi:hypothetical protein
MNPIFKNILAAILGIVVGSIVNMALIMTGHSIVPLPEGTDASTMEGLKAAMPLFTPKHFIMPFLAHALGTLAGAFVAAKIAASHKLYFALGVGAVFLLGGIKMTMDLPSPMWFTLLDLLGAYIPMAYLGFKITDRNS